MYIQAVLLISIWSSTKNLMHIITSCGITRNQNITFLLTLSVWLDYTHLTHTG